MRNPGILPGGRDYGWNLGAASAQWGLPMRGPLATASDDLDRLGSAIEADSPGGLVAEARELATVVEQWTTVLRRLDRTAGEAWISFAAGPAYIEQTAELLRGGTVDAVSMYSVGYAVLQAYGRLELTLTGGPRRPRAPGTREPEWWGSMLARLEPREPDGWRRAAWRHLDVALTGARERLVAHRGVGHIDEVAIFSDRTLVLHRRVDGSPPRSALAQVEALYGAVVGTEECDDVQDMMLGLVHSAGSLDAAQRSQLRRLFGDVGYPPIDPATLSRRIALLLQTLVGRDEAP